MNVHVKLLIKIILLSFIPIFFVLIICMGLIMPEQYDFISAISSDTLTKRYEIESNTYLFEDKYKNISIEYPTLKTNCPNLQLDIVNDLIKIEAIKLGNGYDYVYEVKDYNYLELKLNYEIKYLSDSNLSIAYKGMVSPRWANHPTHLFYTLNIDLRSVKCIRLQDMVKVDNKFLKLFKEQIENHKTEPYADVDSYFNRLSDDEMLKYLKSSNNLDSSSENYYEVFSYFTDKEICVAYPVPYAVGNHTIIKIDMDKLK